MRLVNLDDAELRIKATVLKHTEKMRYGALNIGLIDKYTKALQDTPEIMPPKKGHWEIYVISPFDGEGCKCSLCENEGMPSYDFCPKCGAAMEGTGYEG